MFRNVVQSPPEYHVDDDTTWLSRKRIWGKQREPKKDLITWFERISRKWGFCWRVGGGCEIQKNKEKKGRQKTCHDELLKIQKEQLKLFEESEKRF